MVALLIVEVNNNEEVNKTRMLFHGLKLDMEKWLLRGNKPLVLYVAQVVDMLLWKWLLIEGHQSIG
jgi:hypothetical protein